MHLCRPVQDDEHLPDDVHLIKELTALRSRRLLRTLAVVQDFSDALMAINDITGESDYLVQSAQHSLLTVSPDIWVFNILATKC